MMKKGISALSNAELLAIIFGTGTRNESAVELARKVLLRSGNNLNLLARMNLKEICEVKGIGEAKAITLLTALELGRRRSTDEAVARRQIKTSRDVFDVFGPRLGDLPHEEFWILLLRQSNTIIDEVKISQGGITGTVTDVRMILKTAIDKMACSLILCHNHPSGTLAPSEQDKEITRKIKDGGKLLDISVIDHIIVTASDYYSFSDNNIL
jgi:DNA repair protein RadC